MKRGMNEVEPALVERVRGRLAAAGGSPTSASVAAALRSEAGVRGDAELLEALRSLRSELVGAGPLETLLADPAVTDVLVNSPEEIWVDRGAGLERAAVRFTDDDAVRRLAVRLAATTGRRLDLAQPFVDARLPDGSRLHAVLPPISPRATCLSLRVLRDRSFTLDGLVTAGSVQADLATVLRALVAARIAVVVSGGTGSGKTTLLGVLLGLADPGDRLVLVEDAGELQVDRPHVVRLETRPPNVESAGAVELRALVRQALRMRPDRIVVGEVRGPEVVDLLTALNTGHEGSLTTLHANSAFDVPSRLEALAGLAGLNREALHSQLAAGLQAVAHLRRESQGVRRVVEVAVLVRGSTGIVQNCPRPAHRGRPPGARSRSCGAAKAAPRPRGARPGSARTGSGGFVARGHRLGPRANRPMSGRCPMLTAAAICAACSAALAAHPIGRPVLWPVRGGLRRPFRLRRPQAPWALAAAGLLLLPAGPIAGVLGMAGGALFVRAVRRGAVERQATVRRRGVAELLGAFAVELETGVDAASALARAASGSDPGLAELLAPVQVAATQAGDISEALGSTGVGRLQELAACWRVCRSTGAALAPLATRLAKVADADDARFAEVRAALAGPRASGRLLAGLPIAGIGMAGLIGGSPLRFLLHTAIGVGCLLLGFGLDIAGLAWLEHLARRALP